MEKTKNDKINETIRHLLISENFRIDDIQVSENELSVNFGFGDNGRVSIECLNGIVTVNLANEKTWNCIYNGSKND